jgi:hypothetical protein
MSETLTREQIERHRECCAFEVVLSQFPLTRRHFRELMMICDMALASLTPEQKGRDVDSAPSLSGSPTNTEGGGTWISVSERLPDFPDIDPPTGYALYSDYVLCYCPDWFPREHVMQGAFSPATGGFIGWVGSDNKRVSHWMPRPPAPGTPSSPLSEPNKQNAAPEIAALVERINGLCGKCLARPWDICALGDGYALTAYYTEATPVVFVAQIAFPLTHGKAHAETLLALYNAWPLIATALGSGTSPNTVSEPNEQSALPTQ